MFLQVGCGVDIVALGDARRGFEPCSAADIEEGVRNFVFGHNMSKRCMYANQKETLA
ncbi:DUF1851 domain-containing protein [Pseudomonas sp. S31]|nr:DUF1851 domain-containing protein [Pseudomonas sp. S31]